MSELRAGASQVEITPEESVFLWGYPHVDRYSTGIHDPLFSTALYITDSRQQLMFIANDIIFISKQIAAKTRQRIADRTSLQTSQIMVTATHTHSGPMTVKYASNVSDSVVPEVDDEYICCLEDRIVEVGVRAFESAEPADIGLSVADALGVGTNRRDPSGPADPEVPVLVARARRDRHNLACMVVYSMHPTVLHEDSTLVSADFPGMTRSYLQENVLGGCPFLYHTGPSGNQSPRHVTCANTFEEAERLGRLLGQAIERTLADIVFRSDVNMGVSQYLFEAPRRSFPSVSEAEETLRRTVNKLESLKRIGAPTKEIRTAECDWFGAEETLTLARMEAKGSLDDYFAACLPAEIQAFSVGPWAFTGWPGEAFVEYALELKKECADCYVIALANGEFQGYIVTQAAAAEGGYEASNALFEPQTGEVLVRVSTELVKELRSKGNQWNSS